MSGATSRGARYRAELGAGIVALEEGEGLWIVPCEGVHSFFMKFAIDVVFINKKRVVTKLRPNMVKSRIALSLRAHSTLELPVGMIQKSQTAVGDQLDLERYEA